uniref:Uncharacterized protein TCIL3000_11_16280 n=1 Tax=Trypanosoma congolense (strain IL3000) TaxID=1068625 RepID=G0V395_TRYCI|nr:unnamed protein product [Trypanosoma congolense IL3000]
MRTVKTLLSDAGGARATGIDFSLNGRHLLASTTDDSMYILDTYSLCHVGTFAMSTVGIHLARYTRTDGVVCVAPQRSADGNLYLFNLNAGKLFSAMSLISDDVSELVTAGKHPVYTAVAQSPSSDTIAALFSPKGRLLLFHPLISGAVAASKENAVVGNSGVVSFSPDGEFLVVGDSECVRVFDYRKLFSGPLLKIDGRRILSSTDPLRECRCIGVDVDVGGSRLLITYEGGRVVLYDVRKNVLLGSDTDVAGNEHYRDSDDAIGARFLSSSTDAFSFCRLTMGERGTPTVLVYSGCKRRNYWAELSQSVHCRGGGFPTAAEVCRCHKLMATAAGEVTLWSFGI